MFETAEDVAELQALLDRSRDRAGDHLKGIFEGEGPFRRVEALELSERLTGMRLLIVGTVTGSGAPRVAPVDGHFHRGRWFFSTPGNAFRIRHLKANPGISAVHVEGETLFVQVHGQAELIADGDPAFDELDARWKKHYGSSVRSMGPELYFVRLQPDRMLAYAFDETWTPGRKKG